jgi:tRNA nucleotidyltransferase (CCA-adding enzyme)
VDGAYRDHRRPEGVTFTRSLTEDLKRRDFTVNAMAFSPSRGLIDPMGGQWDIDQKLIRAVGDPEARFREDALRILRALRFAARLVFSIEPGPARALWDQRDSLAFVARERVGAEICRLVTGPGAAAVAEAHRPVLVSALPPLAAASDGASREGLARLARAPAAPAPRLAALVSPIRRARGRRWIRSGCPPGSPNGRCAWRPG